MSKPPEDDKTRYGDPLATLIPILLVLALVSGWVGYLARHDQRTIIPLQEQQHENQH
jgi:hypothetical protein